MFLWNLLRVKTNLINYRIFFKLYHYQKDRAIQRDQWCLIKSKISNIIHSSLMYRHNRMFRAFYTLYRKWHESKITFIATLTVQSSWSQYSRNSSWATFSFFTNSSRQTIHSCFCMKIFLTNVYFYLFCDAYHPFPVFREILYRLFRPYLLLFLQHFQCYIMKIVTHRLECIWNISQ